MSAHNNIVWGVRAYLDRLLPQMVDIGLYPNLSGTASELRWIENPIYFTTYIPEDWATGILLKDNSGQIIQKADFRIGGNRARFDGANLRIRNTDQIIQTLAAYGIKLSGIPVEIYEFEGTDDAGDSSVTLIKTGVFGDPQWDAVGTTLPIVDSNYKRRANVLTIINNDSIYGNYPSADTAANGKAIPATFGKYLGSKKQYAKSIRTASKKTIWSNISDSRIGNGAPGNQTQFPVVGASYDGTVLVVRVALTWDRSGIWNYDLGWSNTFIKIVEGASGVNKNGDARLIKGAYFGSAENDSHGPSITVILDSLFATPLFYSDTTPMCWVEFIKIDSQCRADIWPCKAYLDKSDNEISDGLELFSYESPKTVNIPAADTGNIPAVDKNTPVIEKPISYIKLPPYGYITAIDPDRNKIDTCPMFFNGDSNNIKCFFIFPVKNPALISDANLSSWNMVGWHWNQNGLYAWAPSVATMIQTGDISTVIDKDSTTKSRFSISVASDSPHDVMLGIEFDLPDVGCGFSFDEVFLGIMTGTSCTALELKWKKFFYKTYSYGLAGGVNYDMPDFYFTDAPDNKNGYFLVSNYGEAYSLYTNYLMSDLKEENLVSNYKNALFFICEGIGVYNSPKIIDLFELAFIFSKTTSIKDCLYSAFSGRIFDDTWGLDDSDLPRKTSTLLMQYPYDIIEHLCRLQNWSEVGDVVDYGRQYSPGAKIKRQGVVGIDADGSFDAYRGNSHSSMISHWTPNDIYLARQILDFSDGYTDDLITSICKDLFCVQFQDGLGYECIDYLLRTEDSPDQIDITKIIKFDSIDEPQAKDTCCSPFVHYNYDYGSGNFSDLLQVLLPSATSWTALMTPGFTGIGNLEAGRPDGQVVWEICSQLWKKFRQDEAPASEVTEKKWFNRYEDALWYIYNWVRWQGKSRSTITVPYTIGRSWRIGTHISVMMPKQTNGKYVECIIEELSKNKKQEDSDVIARIIFINDITTAEKYQFTNNTEANVLQDTDISQAEKLQFTN